MHQPEIGGCNRSRLVKQFQPRSLFLQWGERLTPLGMPKAHYSPAIVRALLSQDCDGKVRTIGSSMHAQFTNLNEANRLS
jgi:hypothetical protein